VKVNFIDANELGCCARIANWVLGLEANAADEEKHHKEMEEHVQELSTLSQSTTQKVILYTNLVIIVSLALFLYIYFSINPFTSQEIYNLRQISLNKTTTEIYPPKIEL